MAGNKEVVTYIKKCLHDHAEHDPTFERLAYHTGGDLGTYDLNDITAALLSLSFAFRNEDPTITTHPTESEVLHGVTEYLVNSHNTTLIIRRELPAVLTMTTEQSGLLHSEWHSLT